MTDASYYLYFIGAFVGGYVAGLSVYAIRRLSDFF